MSQPENRTAEVILPNKLDESLQEFWVENPWQIAAFGHNLSSFERNRVFLNSKGTHFLEISHLTATDSDGDGRAVLAADFRNNGQLDLVVRQIGGGALLLFENRFPAKNYLKVALNGQKSNRRGIGARVVATVGKQQIVREMYPYNGYFSQSPNLIHFGLADADKVDELSILWPSGEKQILKNLAGNRFIEITEGKTETDAIRVVKP